METTATAPVTATVKAKGGNKKKASAPKANAKATTKMVASIVFAMNRIVAQTV